MGGGGSGRRNFGGGLWNKEKMGEKRYCTAYLKEVYVKRAGKRRDMGRK